MQKQPNILEALAEKAGVTSDKYLKALRSVAFATAPEIKVEEMMSVLIIAKKLDLDPFAREIYAIPGRQGQPIQPVISYDGWMKVLLRQPTYDGMEVIPSDTKIRPEGMDRDVHEWCEVIIYDKTRSHPLRVREYFEEVTRARKIQTRSGKWMLDPKNPWVQMPWRMLRNKTVIQAVRNNYAVGGFDEVLSEDELENEAMDTANNAESVAKERAEAKVTRPGYPTIEDKEGLHSLLERLVNKLLQTGKAVKAGHSWIKANLAEDTQSYAVTWLTNHYYAKQAEAQAEAALKEEAQTKTQVEAKPEPEAVELDEVAQPQKQASVEAPTTSALDDMPDDDCYDLESFQDNVDIDAM